MIEATMKEKVKEFIVKNFKWIILFICLIGFLAIAENVFNKEIMNGDIVGYKLISTFLISDFATPIAKFITNFGDAIFLTVLTIILFILIKNKKIGLSIFSNLVIITALNQLLKNILQRPRPTEYRIIEETGYSFPSGHSIFAATWLMLAVGFSQLLGKRSFKAELLIGAMTIWGVLMLISRVRLGMHYPIDLFVAIISAWIVHLIIFGFLQKKGLFNNK